MGFDWELGIGHWDFEFNGQNPLARVLAGDPADSAVIQNELIPATNGFVIWERGAN